MLAESEIGQELERLINEYEGLERGVIKDPSIASINKFYDFVKKLKKEKIDVKISEKIKGLENGILIKNYYNYSRW